MGLKELTEIEVQLSCRANLEIGEAVSQWLIVQDKCMALYRYVKRT